MPSFTPGSPSYVAPSYGAVEAPVSSVQEPTTPIVPPTDNNSEAFLGGVATMSWAGQYAAKGLLNATQGTDFIVSPMLRKAEHALGLNETGYKPPVEELKGTKYEKYIDTFQQANNQSEFNSTKLWYDTMESFQESSARNPVASTIGMVAAGFADPINLIGLPALPAKIAMAGKAEITAYNAATAAVVFGGLGGLAGALQKDNNAAMTNDDVLHQAIASGVIGSVVGAAAGYYSATQIAKMTTEFKNRSQYGRITPPGAPKIITEKVQPKPELVITDKPPAPKQDVTLQVTPSPRSNNFPDASFSPEVTAGTPGEVIQETIPFRPMTKASKFLSKAASGNMNAFRGEGFVALDSNIPAVNKAGQFFMRSEIQLAGEPGDVINAPYFLDKARGKISETLAKEKFLYHKYASSSPTSMSHTDLMKEVSITKAMKRVDPTYKSGIPEVEATVHMHNEITKNINTRLAKARIMDANNIENYQPRVWNRVSANRISPQLEEKIALEQWNRDPSAWSSHKEAIDALHERLRTIREGQEPSDLKYLDDAMNGDLLGGGGTIRRNKGAGDAFTKHKDLRFDDDLLLKYDLIESNASDLTASYVMKAEKLLQKRRFLDLNGVQTVSDLLQQARNEADSMATEFGKTVTDPKQLESYRKELDRGVLALERLIEEHDGIRLQPSAIDPFLDILSTYTTTHMLGGQMISSSTDAFYGTAKLGFQDSFNYGFMPMLKELASWDFTVAKNADKEAKELGLVIDIMINDGLHSLMNGGDSVIAGATRVQKTNAHIRDFYSKMTGIEYHDRFNTNWILTTSATKLGHFLDDYKAGTLHPDDLQFLNQMGLAERHLEGMYNQFKRYAVQGKGVTLPMLSDWPESTPTEIFYKQLTEQTLQNIVRSIILRPQQAELPYMMLSSRFGKLWGMFKSFSAAGSHRILIGIGQNKQSWRIPAIMSIIAMGSMQSIIKSKIKGEEPDMSMDNLIAQGIARSGVLPLFYDQLLSASPWSGYKGKYGDSNFINTLVGPGIGQSIDLSRLVTGVTNGNWKDPSQWKFDETDRKRAAMMIPGSNLFWFQGGITAAGLRSEHRTRTKSTKQKSRKTRS